MVTQECENMNYWVAARCNMYLTSGFILLKKRCLSWQNTSINIQGSVQVKLNNSTCDIMLILMEINFPLSHFEKKQNINTKILSNTCKS